uniref:Uncharacterized protein n=1 Tax=Glossina palpalis gambiensis TaxID=67801 RepID=A0A1B0B4S3_9MUSC
MWTKEPKYCESDDFKRALTLETPSNSNQCNCPEMQWNLVFGLYLPWIQGVLLLSFHLRVSKIVAPFRLTVAVNKFTFENHERSLLREKNSTLQNAQTRFLRIKEPISISYFCFYKEKVGIPAK